MYGGYKNNNNNESQNKCKCPSLVQCGACQLRIYIIPAEHLANLRLLLRRESRPSHAFADWQEYTGLYGRNVVLRKIGKRNFLTIEDTGTKNPVTIARENLGAVYAT